MHDSVDGSLPLGEKYSIVNNMETEIKEFVSDAKLRSTITLQHTVMSILRTNRNGGFLLPVHKKKRKILNDTLLRSLHSYQQNLISSCGKTGCTPRNVWLLKMKCKS